MKIRWIARGDIDSNYRRSWDELLEHSGNYRCFSSASWCLGICELLERELLVLEARSEDDVLQGIWPLTLRRGAHSQRRWLCPVDISLTDYAEPVLRTGCAREAAYAMLEAALAHMSEWDALAIANVDEWSAVVEAAQRLLLLRAAPPVELEALALCPIVELPSSFEEVLRRHRHRGQLRHHLKALEAGRVRIEAPSEEIGAQCADTFLRLHLAAFGQSPFSDARVADFLRSVWPGMWKKRHMSGLAALIDDEPVAFHLHMRRPGELGGYNAGVLPEHRRLQLGTALLLESIQRGISERLSSINLFRGCAAYKMRWATRVSKLVCFGMRVGSAQPIARDWVAAELGFEVLPDARASEPAMTASR